MLDKTFFTRVGPNTRDRYRRHIFDDAKDVKGKKFKGYSTYGSKWVTMNVKKSFRQSAPKEGYSYSQAKKGKMFPRQDDKYANTTAPVLSGDLYKDFGSIMRISSTGFEFGWAAQGAKIKWLKDMGRVLSASNQPLPDKVIQYLSKESRLYINKKLPKGKKTYRIGR